MDWLDMETGIAAGGGAGLGLVTGLILRGLGGNGKAKEMRAQRDLVAGERDVLQAELEALRTDQSRDRQSDRADASGSDALSEALTARDEKIRVLNDELLRSKQALEDLKTGDASRPDQTPRAAASPTDNAPADLSERLVDLERQRDEITWRNRYLESRVRMLEDTLARAEDAVPAVSSATTVPAEDVGQLKAEVDRLTAELNAAKTDRQPREDVEQEIARLRWRNRYLESRIDYLEGSADAAPETETAPAPPIQRDAPTAVEPVRPSLLEGPRSDAPRDLEQLDGIGPLMHDRLNALGVFHLDQIAAFSPAELAWIENQIGFPGRADRERWVEKARAILSNPPRQDEPAG